MEVMERPENRTKPVERKAEKPISELFHDMLNDKIHKYASSPKGAVAYTGLNLIVSLLPAASFLIDDTMIEHVVQHFVDDRFSLKDEGGPKQKQIIAKLLQNNDALLMLRQIAIRRAKQHRGLTEDITNSTHHPEEFVSHEHAQQSIQNAREKWQRLSKKYREQINTVQNIGHLQDLQFKPDQVHQKTHLTEALRRHAQTPERVAQFVSARNARVWFEQKMHPDKSVPTARVGGKFVKGKSSAI